MGYNVSVFRQILIGTFRQPWDNIESGSYTREVRILSTLQKNIASNKKSYDGAHDYK